MGEVAVGSEMTREGARDHVLVSRPLTLLERHPHGASPPWGVGPLLGRVPVRRRGVRGGACPPERGCRR